MNCPLALLLAFTPSVQDTESPEEPVPIEAGAEEALQQAPPFTSLPPLTGLGPKKPDYWRTFRPRPGPSSDTLSVKSNGQDVTLENAIVQASTRTAMMFYSGQGPYRNTTIRDTILRVEMGTLNLDRSYWGIRAYDMIDTLFERIEITNFGRVTPQHDEGHAMYLNLAGSFTLKDSYIHHNGGQGLQIVHRPTESNLERGPAQGTILIQNTRFRENGFNPDRGGFQVSIFGTGQAIRFEDVEITAGLDHTVYHRGLTGGALLIEAEGFNPARPLHAPWWRPPVLPEGWEMPFSQKKTELIRVRIRHTETNKPLIQIKGCEELIVRECEFHGGRIELDAPKKTGRNCGRIVWEGNHGEAPVFVAGQYRGLAKDNFVVESSLSRTE